MTTADAAATQLVVTVEESLDVDPIALFTAAREADREAALWLQPAAGFALVGVGRAWSIEPAGAGRFGAVAAAWQRLLNGAAVTRDEASTTAPVGPVLLGGLGFNGRQPAAGDAWAPFGAASLVLPVLTFARTTEGAWRTTAIVDPPGESVALAARRLAREWERLIARAGALSPGRGAVVARPVDAPLATVGELPDRAAWDRLAGLFAGAVGRGRLDKVVLARRVDLRSPVELDIENALRRLGAAAPESSVFAFVRGGRTFMGATPERLVRTRGRAFETVAIAGSAPRGATATDDAARAAALMASDKEREEHAVVVAMLRRSLAPLAERLEVAADPAILPLRTVQHLVTPIRGVLRDGSDVIGTMARADGGGETDAPASGSVAGLLGLVERLHPTPAVAGEPRDLALEMIAEHEGWERGWYAGPVGWLDAAGDGEMMVALRCGIVAGRDATLFAGCGIVADSDPAAEWAESRLKLRALASALGTDADA